MYLVCHFSSLTKYEYLQLYTYIFVNHLYKCYHLNIIKPLKTKINCSRKIVVYNLDKLNVLMEDTLNIALDVRF